MSKVISVVPVSSGGARRFKLSWSRREQLTPYLFLLPCALALAAVFLYPIFEAIKLSFQSDDISAAGANFVGFKNYANVISNPYFYHALGISTVYTIGNVILVWVIGLGGALLVHENYLGRGVFRCALVLPWAVPYVASALIWSWMFNYEFGVLRYLVMTASGTAPDFLNKNPYALISVTGASVWKAFPLGMVMLLAGLQSIPKEQYEAAVVDGAGPISQFLHVTLPGLRTISVFLVLLVAIWSFGRAFTIIYVLTGGGPARGTETVVIRAYNEVFRFFHPGTGAALATIILVISLVFSVIYLAFLHRAEE
ncbi:carbohydrate ABC transporter permease [Ensifer aridi]|uniref:carbohydrate ABC transporter permease n=1 Tax=Ensifer aridi TaxID=1708715 RepID=UPI0006842A9B|nr:sugar ABC transporter permease [Ensifer aridi]